ncbi:DTW-domain-containing protein [Basidiobolus meristosporus CBS 931.73]|uniref:tRNA-uridine aminocarboxypropyltransferase n=1 Tax=Basidiobolus meristosporus CBS 931.73 TaxID=1314790 RepID=A0A1Y1YMA4_9FUNG|nr:DTW-domain-containing protein [Basidiobolus meristosporus CBS 931.73]|eukprot:ORX98973.1 DTW-domain-containing protein [Basidiobolus meristosporus CBS 931.73]
MTQSVFEALPQSVILRTFSYLDYANLCRVSQTCSHFEKLASSDILWKDLVLKRWPERHHCTVLEQLVNNDDLVTETTSDKAAVDNYSTANYTNTYWSWKRTYLGDLKWEHIVKSDEKNRKRGNTVDGGLKPISSDENFPGIQKGRSYCASCWRPVNSCICDSLTSEQYCNCRVRIVVLQHPKCQVSIGTLRILKHTFKYCDIFVGKDFSEGKHPDLDVLLNDDSYTPLLLYPGPNATDVKTLQTRSNDMPSTDKWHCLGCTCDQRSSHSNSPRYLVIAIDGTWSHAKYLYRFNPRIQRIRQIMLPSPEPSIYHALKREPRPTCISTVEAVGRAIGILGWDSEEFLMEDLLRPLHRIIQIQREFHARNKLNSLTLG